jgi:hypothetical protein
MAHADSIERAMDDPQQIKRPEDYGQKSQPGHRERNDARKERHTRT